MQQDIPELLRQYQQQFSKVVKFDPQSDVLAQLDLTARNAALPLTVTSDTKRFSDVLATMRHEMGARYLIGGYNELRQMYSRSELFDQDVMSDEDPAEPEEPRRLHIGADIWADVGTEVFCPYEGEIHSFRFNNNFGDYGATIILRHEFGGITIHTLYGHLSLRDLENLSVGARLKQGDLLAHFGSPDENGQWPPHLHFQLIVDMQDMFGDYPGVCKLSEKNFYLANCPDPDLILQMNQYIATRL